ncbi:hypothetical protein ES705_40372 [subsurface metagenome]
MDNGYQVVVQYATSTEFDFSLLQNANNTSTTSVIDPYEYQGGDGFTKELDIIINMESQDWHVTAGRTPTDADLSDPAKNTMKVDWIRIYKPVEGQVSSLIKSGINDKNFMVYPNPVNSLEFSIVISESLKGGTIEIWDITGRKLSKIEEHEAFLTLSSDVFPGPGLYIIQLRNDHYSATQKVAVN